MVAIQRKALEQRIDRVPQGMRPERRVEGRMARGGFEAGAVPNQGSRSKEAPAGAGGTGPQVGPNESIKRGQIKLTNAVRDYAAEQAGNGTVRVAVSKEVSRAPAKSRP